MEAMVRVALTVAVLATMGQRGWTRPQGTSLPGLPISDLVSTQTQNQGFQVRPEDQVTLHDLTSDGAAVNEVIGSGPLQGFTADVTFQFPPTGSIGGGSAHLDGYGLGPAHPQGSSPDTNVAFGLPSSVLSADAPGSDDVQFNLPGPPEFPGTGDVQFNFPSPSEPSPGTGDVVLTFPDPTGAAFPSPTSAGSPLPSSSSFPESASPSFHSTGGSPPFVDPTTATFPEIGSPALPNPIGPPTLETLGSDGFTVPGFGGHSLSHDTTNTLAASSLPGVDAAAAVEVSGSEPKFNDEFPIQNPTQFGGVDTTQFGETGSPSTLNFEHSSFSADTSNPIEVLPRTLGNGNHGNPADDRAKEELLSLLTLGLFSQQQSSSSSVGVASSNSQAPADPLTTLFNLLTLGLFDGNNNQSGPNPIKDLLSKLTFGILGNGNQGSAGGFDLSKIGLGPAAIEELVQVASTGLDDFTRETSIGIRLAQDEVQYLSQEKLRQLLDNLQETGRTFGMIGQNTYRSVLQKKDAVAKLLSGVVENLGTYVNTSVRNTFDKVGNTANTFGRFINDLKVGLLNALIAKGEAVRELVSGTLGTVGSSFTDFTSAAQAVAEDNIRSITGIKALRKIR